MPSAPTVGNLDNYVFVVISDTHFVAEADPPAAAGFGAFLSAQGAEFVIVGGDLADAGLPDEYDRYADWAGSLGVPVYSAIGNHDLYNGGWSTFRTTVGASYYSFVIGTRSFYFLDSGNGTLGRDQIAMLRDAFAGDLNPKVVITHYPLYDGDDSQYYELTNTAERAALVDLYARSAVELLLEGHTHALNHTHDRVNRGMGVPEPLGARGRGPVPGRDGGERRDRLGDVRDVLITRAAARRVSPPRR